MSLGTNMFCLRSGITLLTWLYETPQSRVILSPILWFPKNWFTNNAVLSKVALFTKPPPLLALSKTLITPLYSSKLWLVELINKELNLYLFFAFTLYAAFSIAVVLVL